MKHVSLPLPFQSFEFVYFKQTTVELSFTHAALPVYFNTIQRRCMNRQSPVGLGRCMLLRINRQTPAKASPLTPRTFHFYFYGSPSSRGGFSISTLERQSLGGGTYFSPRGAFSCIRGRESNTLIETDSSVRLGLIKIYRSASS